jgi:FkbM family methyltransferase
MNLSAGLWRRIDRTLKYCGLYVRRTVNHPAITTAKLYRDVVAKAGGKEDGTGAIFFDVGANLGQTAIEFARSFPGARIHAFEPVSRIFKRLEQKVSAFRQVTSHRIALGDVNEERRIALKSASAECAVNQMFRLSDDRTAPELVEVVKIVRLDDFCLENGIDVLAVLKCDTEGFDLQVLEGAATMLRNGRIKSVMVEVSFAQGDNQHTHYDSVAGFLLPIGFAVVGFYETWYVHKDGRMLFTNALFKLK